MLLRLVAILRLISTYDFVNVFTKMQLEFLFFLGCFLVFFLELKVAACPAPARSLNRRECVLCFLALFGSTPCLSKPK